jgi:hypothetical protein
MEHVRLAREDRLLTANTQTIQLLRTYFEIYRNFDLLLVPEVNRDLFPPMGNETYNGYIFTLRGIYEMWSTNLINCD